MQWKTNTSLHDSSVYWLQIQVQSQYVDGMDVSKVPHNVWRPRLIAAPQEPILFPGIMRGNMYADGDDKAQASTIGSDEHVIECLQKVQVRNMIRLRRGLDSDVCMYLA